MQWQFWLLLFILIKEIFVLFARRTFAFLSKKEILLESYPFLDDTLTYLSLFLHFHEFFMIFIQKQNKVD